MLVKLQIIGRLRERVAQTIVKDEGVYGESEMVWLNQRFSHSFLKSSISTFCKLSHLVLCNVLGRSLVCGCYV
jgi:hypothetical protein